MTPYQWSIKLDSGEIYVVQAETSEELGIMIEEIKTKFFNTEIDEIMKDPLDQETKFARTGLVCKTCGSKAEKKEGINKNGNPYVLNKCSANYKHNWFD